ncbi:MAG: endonuclease/exonuclease/phosphatase family protein [Flavobacteriales bacterium]
MKLTIKHQLLIGCGLVLLSLSHWFPIGINLLELLGAFAHFTLMLSILVLLASAVKRLWVLTAASFISVILCAMLVAPHFSSIDKSNDVDITIGQFNLYHHNPSPELALTQISELNADVISIQELNSDWSGLVDSIIRPNYPYSVEEPWSNCCYGTGLYSKYPLTSAEVKSHDGIPVVYAEVNVGETIVRVISLHTFTPVFPNQTEERNRSLKAIAEFVMHEGNPSIVFGDFNIVPWEKTFQNFLQTGGLTEVACGFQATYPVDLGFPLIPIDHINYTAEFEPTNCGSMSISGSDHKAIYASFKLKD